VAEKSSARGMEGERIKNASESGDAEKRKLNRA
jgi:hypothetical protein